MILVYLFEDGRLVHGGEELLARTGPKWVDVEGQTEEELARLKERFGLHRLAVEDSLHLDQRPKLEEYPEHLFIVLHGFTTAEDVVSLTLHEHHFFLGTDWLVTAHALPFDGYPEVRRRLEADPAGTLGRGADYVAYMVADTLVDRNFPILDAFSDELEALEASIFESPDATHLQRIFEMKRMMVEFRRVLAPQRDVVASLMREGLPHVADRTRLYFRDVYDHLVRLYESIDTGRDLLGNVRDAYLSVTANRTNDISKQLTIFATIFLPLSFITGFFGQNFPELGSHVWWFVMWGSIIALPVALVFWFKKKQWI